MLADKEEIQFACSLDAISLIEVSHEASASANASQNAYIEFVQISTSVSFSSLESLSSVSADVICVDVCD